MAARDPKVHVIRFSRNCGYQRSLLTAYKAATGDCSIQLDCDLQDPPELIPQMLDLWRQGHQVVYGIRRSTDEGAVTYVDAKIKKYSGLNSDSVFTDFAGDRVPFAPKWNASANEIGRAHV